MSKYTTEVRYICETAAGLENSAGFNDVNTIIEQAAPKIFNFDFPMFDESYRLLLEIKILRHYYTREICAETVGLWKLWLQDKLNVIMPYYNKLYESETFKFNPLYDVDINRTHTKVNDGTTENEGESSGTNAEQGTANTNSNNWSLYSDTPQGGLDGLIEDETELTENNYLTNATHDINSGNSSFNNSGTNSVNTNSRTTLTNTEDYIEKVTGKQGSASYSKMLVEYRNSLLNIDKMILDELADLFFNLY